jgi:hypothetical protein
MYKERDAASRKWLARGVYRVVRCIIALTFYSLINFVNKE